MQKKKKKIEINFVNILVAVDLLFNSLIIRDFCFVKYLKTSLLIKKKIKKKK